MATLIINSSSSQCGDCAQNGLYSSAKPSEDGHFTRLGYDKELNGTPGCGALWDRVSIPYSNGYETSEQIIHRLKYEWGYATNVPDENWSAFGWGTL